MSYGWIPMTTLLDGKRPSSLRATEMEVRRMVELVIAILSLIAAVLQLINWLL